MGNSVMLNGVEYAGEQIAYKDSTYCASGGCS